MASLSDIVAFFLGRSRTFGPVEKVFFGIGNPGRNYENTRHNAGFMALDCFFRSATALGRQTTGLWEARSCRREGAAIALVKPKTYVNQCGEALRDCIERMHCPLSSCLVIVDDFHLPIGTLRMRPGGSDGGHNGLKSIIDHVGREFPRLRIGIGPAPDDFDSVRFVLDDFDKSETPALLSALKNAESAMTLFATRGIGAAMNAYNK